MPVSSLGMDEGWTMDAGLSLDQAAPAPPAAFRFPVHKQKGRTMDYIPIKRSDRYLWYKDMSANVTTEAPKMGVAPADATAMKALVDEIIAKYDATNAAQAALDSARIIERTVEPANVVQIRAKIRNWKTLPNYASSGSEGVLHLHGADSGFDPATYKPVIKISHVPGGVKVSFVKKGVEGMAIYMRVAGTTTWRKVGMDTETPFIDTTPLATAGVPENREYMARGVLHDAEIGLDSDTANITFAG